MNRKILGMFAGAALLFGGVSTAVADHESFGGWIYDNNPGGYEYLVLGFGDGWGYAYEGTAQYCGERGVGYATMRQTLDNSGYAGRWVYWWIDYTCGDYDRICIDNSYQVRCSTYRYIGERRLDE